MNPVKKKIKVGAITLGQSPRVDMIPEIEATLGADFEIIQAGAVDQYSYQEIITRFSPKTGEQLLVSKLRDGREVALAEKHVIPLLQDCIDQLAGQGVDVILLLCTGSFPNFNFPGLIITPQTILQQVITGLIGDKKLGIMVPAPNQLAQISRRWRDSGIIVEAKAASPYQKLAKLAEKAREFVGSEVEVILLDCMGYSKEMKEVVVLNSGKKVVLARTMVAAVVRELLS